MADDMKAVRRRIAAEQSSIEASSEDQPKKKIKLRKYVVRANRRISVETGVYLTGGDVVKMTSKMAKHYLKHNCIDPFIEDDDDVA